MVDLVQRFATAFGRPDGGSVEKVAEEWHRHLGSFDLDVLNLALDRLVRTHDGHARPRLATLRGIASELQRARTGGVSSDMPDGTPGVDYCGRCMTAYEPRFWWRRPRSPADIARAMAPDNRHKGFIRLGGRSHCDCDWAQMIRAYLVDEELAVLVLEDPEDPVIRDEVRRRASSGPTVRRHDLAALKASIGQPIEQGDAFEEPPRPTGQDVRSDLGWSDETPLGHPAGVDLS